MVVQHSLGASNYTSGGWGNPRKINPNQSQPSKQSRLSLTAHFPVKGAGFFIVQSV